MNKFTYIAVTIVLLAGSSITSFAIADTSVDLNVGEKLIAEQKLNINTADVAQLTSIKGLGKKKAQAIVSYIQDNGKLSSVDELVKVKGIGKKLVSKMSPFLTVE